MKIIKILFKVNLCNNVLGFVFYKQGVNLFKIKGDIEYDVCVLFGGMVNEELFFGEEGMINGVYNDIMCVM